LGRQVQTSPCTETILRSRHRHLAMSL